jgi:hypothetical protein
MCVMRGYSSLRVAKNGTTRWRQFAVVRGRPAYASIGIVTSAFYEQSYIACLLSKTVISVCPLKVLIYSGT